MDWLGSALASLQLLSVSVRAGMELLTIASILPNQDAQVCMHRPFQDGQPE